MPDSSAKKQINKYARVDEIAKFAGGLSVRRIQQLTQDGVIETQESPGGGGRVYDLLSTVQRLLLYYREKADSKAAPSDELEEEKLRHLAAKRELAEIKLATEKGHLHHTGDIEAVFGAMLTRLRVGLLALPQGVAPLLLEQTDINTIAEIIMERLTHCLSELSKFDFTAFAESSGSYIEELDTGDDEDERTDDETE